MSLCDGVGADYLVFRHDCVCAVVRPEKRRVRRSRPRDGRHPQDRVVRLGPHTLQAIRGHPHRPVRDRLRPRAFSFGFPCHASSPRSVISHSRLLTPILLILRPPPGCCRLAASHHTTSVVRRPSQVPRSPSRPRPRSRSLARTDVIAAPG